MNIIFILIIASVLFVILVSLIVPNKIDKTYKTIDLNVEDMLTKYKIILYSLQKKDFEYIRDHLSSVLFQKFLLVKDVKIPAFIINFRVISSIDNLCKIEILSKSFNAEVFKDICTFTYNKGKLIMVDIE